LLRSHTPDDDSAAVTVLHAPCVGLTV
jgi:hypothetical protein